MPRKLKLLPRPAGETSGGTVTQVSDSKTCALNYHALVTPWQVVEPLLTSISSFVKWGLCSRHARRVQLRGVVGFQTCLCPLLWALVRQCSRLCSLSRRGRQVSSVLERQGFPEEEFAGYMRSVPPSPAGILAGLLPFLSPGSGRPGQGTMGHIKKAARCQARGIEGTFD